jgi:hypothetical protein
MAGKLYLCATPIGNLDDITFRVLNTLKEVDLIAAEDTRHSIKLLNHFEIRTPMTSYHEYNKVEKARYLVKLMQEGQNIALVTDAGTPAISDPGEESLLGYYNDDTHCITICTDHLLRDHPRSVLLTLTHEAYHAYEHRLVDLFDSLSPQDRELLLFNRVQTYKQEFANYNDGSDDYFGYFFQRVEQDSDSYSTAAADRYYEVLENYISQPD